MMSKSKYHDVQRTTGSPDTAVEFRTRLPGFEARHDYGQLLLTIC